MIDQTSEHKWNVDFGTGKIVGPDGRAATLPEVKPTITVNIQVPQGNQVMEITQAYRIVLAQLDWYRTRFDAMATELADIKSAETEQA